MRALFLVLLLSVHAETIPSMKTKALDGTPVEFPDPSNPKPLLLLFGFSQKSSDDLDAWNKTCTKQYWNDPRIRYYELADLQGLPFFVKPMVLHGMRKVIKPPEQSLFAPYYKDDKLWKQTVGVRDPKYTHLLITNAKGEILWREVGPASAAKCEALEAAVAESLKR